MRGEKEEMFLEVFPSKPVIEYSIWPGDPP